MNLRPVTISVTITSVDFTVPVDLATSFTQIIGLAKVLSYSAHGPAHTHE